MPVRQARKRVLPVLKMNQGLELLVAHFFYLSIV